LKNLQIPKASPVPPFPRSHKKSFQTAKKLKKIFCRVKTFSYFFRRYLFLVVLVFLLTFYYCFMTLTFNIAKYTDIATEGVTAQKHPEMLINVNGGG
jgi:hypothetical protein